MNGNQGHIQEPQPNSTEKDYGILTVNCDHLTTTDGNSHHEKEGLKSLYYLKNDRSRHLTSGTPVKFSVRELSIVTRDIDCKAYEIVGNDDIAKIYVATDVEVIREKTIKETNQTTMEADFIEKHPIVQNLNVYSEALFHVKDHHRDCFRQLSSLNPEQEEELKCQLIDFLKGYCQKELKSS